MVDLSPSDKAVKQAIDEDDAQLLYEFLQQHAKMGRIDFIIDKLYDGFSGRSCLHRACERGKIKCCRKLLELGADPNVMPRQESRDEVQMGPLHLAVQFRQQECASALLEHKLVRVDLPDSTGKTPLHVAAGIGYEWGVKALLDANADPNLKDKNHRSVVEYAKEKGKLSCVQAITSFHEAVTSLQTQSDEAAQTAALPLEKAVRQAIEEDDAQQLYVVLQQHAKMGRIDLIIDKLYDGLRGRSCLHRACEHGKIKCCRKLLELGASPNVMSYQESSNEVRMGPLHMALQCRQQECVSALLKHKLVNADLQDSTGKTPMHVAAGLGYEWGVKALLDANAKLDIKDKQKRSAVEYAEEKRQLSCVQAIHEAVTALQTQSDEAAQTAASPFAPFLQEGDQTSPGSKGLSLVVYHQVQWLLFCRLTHESDISDRVLGYLRSSDACLLLSALKDYEERCRLQAFEPLEQALSRELARGRILNGTWQGLVPGKNFGWIRVQGGGMRVWCHERNVRGEDITEGSEVTFQLQQRNGKEEASMVQAFNPAALDRFKRAALYSTRGLDWRRGSRPIAPKLLMMSSDEASVMLAMGCCVQENEETPHLDKIFVLPPCAQGLPPVDDIFSTSRFQIAKAQNCSNALNAIKSQLDEKDIQVWKGHTKKTLLNKDVTIAVRERVRAEMCTIAFLKMYEMLAAYDLVVPTQDMNKFNTLHLCEAPGAFICATNHYIQSVVKRSFPHLSWDWVGCTLNPYFEGNNSAAMVEDDGFINETPENWFFGQDNSGDMRLPHNISATWERAAKMGQVLLVTADGSIDCSASPSEQEEVVAQLHYCEAVAAVGALAVGGAFVLKMFTLFEHSSICLVHLLSGFFEYTSICKPTMSTPGNSETYIVCKGFKGVDEQYKRKLLSFTGIDWPKSHAGVPRALVPEESISKGFMKNMLRGAEYFARLQGAVISRNLRLFDDFPHQEGRHIADARRLIVGEWIRRFQIVPIDKNCKIVVDKNLSGAAEFNRVGGQRSRGKRSEEGNLETRKLKRAKDDEIRAGTSLVENEAEVATDPAMQVSEFSKKMMAKMGHQDGQGLGKDGSGIHAPIDPTSRSQGARAGLGFGDSGSILQDQDRIRHVDPSDIIWLELDAVKHSQLGKTFDGVCKNNWVQTGAKLKEIQMSKFCQDKIILSLLQVRTGEAKTQAARQYFGCHGVEKIGFVSRSALKLADLQSIVTLALQDKAPDLTGFFKGDEQDLSFIDLYGGQGGFSDYMLWKYNSCGKSIHRWWMLNRQGKKRPNIAGFKAFSSADTSFSYNPAHSDIVDASNMEAMKAFLDAIGATTNPVGMVFGDGTVDDTTIMKLESEHRPRTIELVSMSTLWCQVWSALGVLRTGGSFICKVTDSFSRCAIGTYYLMCHCFRFVTFIKPSMSCPSECERFLVALDFLGQDNETVQSVRAHLAHVLSIAASLPEDKDVVQIIPMAIILQEPFLNRMTKLNERHARSVTSAIEALQKASASNTTRMHVDSQFELRRMGLAGPPGPEKVGKEVDCEMHVEEEKAEKDTVEDRARRLEGIHLR